jgi:hypothetical protein
MELFAQQITNYCAKNTNQINIKYPITEVLLSQHKFIFVKNRFRSLMSRLIFLAFFLLIIRVSIKNGIKITSRPFLYAFSFALINFILI